MRRPRDPWLVAAATSAASFGVHQARFLLLPAGDPVGGHGYLAWAPAVLSVLLALSLGLGLARATARRAPHADDTPSRTASFRIRWALASGVLVAVYAVQEILEGHSVDVIGHGGLVAVPLAVAFGLLLTLVLPRARRAIARVAGHLVVALGAVRPRVAALPALFASAPARAPRAPLAGLGAGRAPPLAG